MIRLKVNTRRHAAGTVLGPDVIDPAFAARLIAAGQAELINDPSRDTPEAAALRQALGDWLALVLERFTAFEAALAIAGEAELLHLATHSPFGPGELEPIEARIGAIKDAENALVQARLDRAAGASGDDPEGGKAEGGGPTPPGASGEAGGDAASSAAGGAATGVAPPATASPPEPGLPAPAGGGRTGRRGRRGQ